MAYVSHEHRLLFIAVPATGSSAVIKALSDLGIGERLPNENLVRDGKMITPSKHSTLDQLKAGGFYLPVSDYLKVAGVRNVFPWLVAKFVRNRTARVRNANNPKSWIHKLPNAEAVINRVKAQAQMTFSEFLHDRFEKQTCHDPFAKYHEGVDLFIHQEAMDHDFEVLKNVVGLPPEATVPLYNVTGALEDGQTFRDFYTADDTNFVYSRCSAFFQRFPEYSFEGLNHSKVR